MTAVTWLLFSVRYEGVENLSRDDGFILAANHISAYDPVLLSLGAYKVKKTIVYMAKEELINIPLIGLLLKGLGAFPVKRGKGDRHAMETAVEVVKSGKILGIFPEGTRSKTGRPMQGKSGVAVIAARSGSTVIPASIYVEKGKFPRRKKIVVRFGKGVSAEALGIHSESLTPEFRAASGKIMDKITEMFDYKLKQFS